MAGGGLNARESGPAVVLKWQPVLDLRPTQMALGLKEVESRVGKLLRMKPGEREDYLRERGIPVVIGPGGALYMVDHHHVARAAWEAGLERVWTETRADLSGLPEPDFWEEMRKRGWVHPYDQFGEGPHDPVLLPENIKGLADDPYRSLAWKVREAGGYDKTSAPFAEFLWADFFRRNLKIRPIFDSFDQSAQEALALARSPLARRLPGYKGP